MSETFILLENFLHCGTMCQQVEDIFNRQPGSTNDGFPNHYLGVNSNPLQQLFVSHRILSTCVCVAAFIPHFLSTIPKTQPKYRPNGAADEPPRWSGRSPSGTGDGSIRLLGRRKRSAARPSKRTQSAAPLGPSAQRSDPTIAYAECFRISTQIQGGFRKFFRVHGQYTRIYVWTCTYYPISRVDMTATRKRPCPSLARTAPYAHYTAPEFLCQKIEAMTLQRPKKLIPQVSDATCRRRHPCR